MQTLVRSPMLAVLGALSFSIALFDRTGTILALMLAPAFAAGISLCSYLHDRDGQWMALTLVVIVTLICAGRISYVLTRTMPSPRTVDTVGTVTMVRPWGRRSYAASIATPEGGFLVRLPFATLTEGMRLHVEGNAVALMRAKQPGGFDEYRYWMARGVGARLQSPRMKVLPPSWSVPMLRYSLYRALVIYMPELTGAYLRAVWTGQREQQLGEAHRAWGTNHILAVSGFHVGVVVLIASLLFGKNTLVLSLLMWGYVLLTGAAPSSLRAGLMLQAALLSRLIGRPAVPFNSVCLAAVLMLCHSPFFFYDIGWRLSVLSAMAIAALYGAWSGRKRIWMWLCACPAIMLAVFPQASYTFNEVPLAGLLLNLFAPAFFATALPVASAAAALRLLDAPFAPALLAAVEGGFRLWGMLADCVAGIIPWTVPWGPFTAWIGAGMFFFLICRFLRFPAARTWAVVTACSLASFWIFL